MKNLILSAVFSVAALAAPLAANAQHYDRDEGNFTRTSWIDGRSVVEHWENGQFWVDDVASEQILVDGNRQQEQVSVRSAEYHVEFSYEQRAKTCWRREFEGYRRVCRDNPPACRTERVCNPQGQCQDQQVCRPVPPTCWDEPVYRDVPYTCYETVRVPHAEKSNDVVANVTVNVGQIPAGLHAHELLAATLNGRDFGLTASRTSRQLLIYQRSSTQEAWQGNTRVLNVVANLRFADLQKTLAPLEGGLQGLSFNGDTVTFTIGRVDNPAVLNINLFAWRKRVFADNQLIGRVLNPGEFSLIVQGGRTLVTIDLNKTGVKGQLKKGYYYKFSVDAILNVPTDALVNKSDLPDLKLTQKVETKKL